MPQSFSRLIRRIVRQCWAGAGTTDTVVGVTMTSITSGTTPIGGRRTTPTGCISIIPNGWLADLFILIPNIILCRPHHIWFLPASLRDGRMERRKDGKAGHLLRDTRNMATPIMATNMITMGTDS
jgi:hypothetical protein